MKNFAELAAEVAVLGEMQEAEYKVCTFLFNCIIRHDERLRLDVSEAIRKALVTPSPRQDFGEIEHQLLRSLRDGLLRPSDPALTAELSQSPVRPVDD